MVSEANAAPNASRWDRIAAIAILGPLGAGLAFSAVRIAGERSHVPADTDYDDARAVMARAGYAPGRDAWTVVPAWSLRAWRSIGAWTPVSGDEIARQPLHRFARLFVVSEPDSGRDVDALTKRFGAPKQATSAGRLDVLEFDLGGQRIAYDFREHLRTADVRIVGGGVDTLCDTWTGAGKRCRNRGDWQHVSRGWFMVSENGDDVMWAHPPSPGQALRVTWEKVPALTGVVVRAGHTREGAERAQAAVRIRVLIDDAEVGVVRRRPKFDFVPEEIEAPASARTGEHRVTFSIETDSDGGNHFAFDAYAVSAGRSP